MAKQPVTRDRFRIFAEIEPEHLGLIVAALSRMGVQNIGHELITDVRTFHQNGKRAFETSASDAIRAFTQEHPTFTRKEVLAHFNAEGRSSGATSTALTNLTKTGEIVALGDANYRRADVKEIEPPKEPKALKRPPSTPRHAISNDTLVQRAMRGRKKISVKGMAEMLISEGRSGKSASPIISRFVAQKLLKQIEPGLYEVVPPKAAKPSKANGKDSAEAKLAAAREADRLRAKTRRDRLKAEREQQQHQPAEEANG